MERDENTSCIETTKWLACLLDLDTLDEPASSLQEASLLSIVSPSMEKNSAAEESGDLEDSSQPTPLSSVDQIPEAEAEPNPRVKSPKEDEILDACRRRDIEELQSLAELPGGFVTDELRQQACTSAPPPPPLPSLSRTGNSQYSMLHRSLTY